MDTKRPSPSNTQKLHILAVVIAQFSTSGFDSRLPKIKEKRRLVRAFTLSRATVLKLLNNWLPAAASQPASPPNDAGSDVSWLPLSAKSPFTCKLPSEAGSDMSWLSEGIKSPST